MHIYKVLSLSVLLLGFFLVFFIFPSSGDGLVRHEALSVEFNERYADTLAKLDVKHLRVLDSSPGYFRGVSEITVCGDLLEIFSCSYITKVSSVDIKIPRSFFRVKYQFSDGQWSVMVPDGLGKPWLLDLNDVRLWSHIYLDDYMLLLDRQYMREEGLSLVLSF